MKNILLCLIVFFSCHLSAQVPSYVPTNGLVGYWPFTGNANDESGNGNNGSVNGATLTTDRFGNPNSAYDFDGNSDIEIPGVIPELLNQSEITYSVWVKQAISTCGSQARIISHENLPVAKGTALQIQSSGFNFLNAFQCDVRNMQNSVGSAYVLDASWIHAVMVFDGNQINNIDRLKLYVNGIEYPLVQYSNCNGCSYPTLTHNDLSVSLKFGHQNQSALYGWGGIIDDVGIWNRALTEEEIAELYNAPSCDLTVDLGADTLGLCAGDSVLLDAGAGYNYYDWSTGDNTQSIYASNSGNYSVTVGDGSCTATDSVYVDVLDATIIQNDTTICFGDSVELSVASAGAIQECDLPLNLQNGLVGYWPFCGNANDESGNGNNGTVNGATLTTDRFGNADNAYDFDGTSSYIDCPSGTTTSLNILGNISYCFWLKTNQTTTGLITAFGNEQASGGGYLAGMNDGGASAGELGYNISGNPSTWSESSIPLNNNNWHFITITLRNDTMRLYIDNVLDNLTTGVQSTYSWSGNRRIGVANYGLIYFYDGLLDDIGIWNRALTESEIQQLYSLEDNPTYAWSTGSAEATITVTPTQTTTYTVTVDNGITTCTDSVTVTVSNPTVDLGADTLGLCAGDSILLDAGAGYNYYDWSTGDTSQTIYATNSGNYSVTVGDGVGIDNDYSMSFDGVDDYVDFGDLSLLDGATSFAFTAWVKNVDLNMDGDIIQKGSHGQNAQFLLFRDNIGATSGRTNIYSVVVSDGTNSSRIESATNSANDTLWHHVAVTFNAAITDGLRLYVDGIEDANSPSTALNISALENSSNSVIVGRGNYYPGGQEFNGFVDEASFWSTALSQSQIQQYMNCPPTGDEAGLVGYWNFEEGSGTTALDQTSNGNDGTVNGATYSTDVPAQTCLGCTATDSVYVDVLDATIIQNDTTICAGNTVQLSVDQPNLSQYLNPNIDYGSVSDIEGNDYATVTIGNQVWMAENLRTATYSNGDAIPQVQDAISWGATNNGAWCVQTAPDWEATYGKFYNHKAVRETRNVCPSGWHVPLISEWDTLITVLGDPIELGGELKSTGTLLWDSPNVGASNSIGFSGLPAGLRSGFFGSVNFNGEGSDANWWTADVPSGSNPRYKRLRSTDAVLDQLGRLGRSGLSVRCIKDDTTSQANNAIQYLWSNGSTQAGTSVSPAETTTYTVTITNGITTCTDSVTVTVSNPTVDLGADTLGLCAGDSILLDAGAGYDNYSWSTGDTSQTIYASNSGNYSVTVGDGSCTATDSVYVDVLNAQIAQNDTTICFGDSVELGLVPDNYSLDFSGENNFCELALNSPDYTQGYSVMFWADLSNFGGTQRYLFDQFNQIGVTHEANGNLLVCFQLSGNTIGNLDCLTFPVASQASWITFTYNQSLSEATLYIDGQNVASSIYTSTLAAVNTFPLTFGSPTNQPGVAEFNNTLDEIHLWNGVLSQAQIQQYMSCSPTGNETGLIGYWDFKEGSGTTIIDQTGNGNNGTINGAVYSTDGPVNCTPDYTWSTGSTEANITVTPAATTTYTVTVDNGITTCTDSVTVTVSNPSSTTEVTECDSYSWNGTEYLASGVYTFETLNANGCDSIATLDLTINASSASTTEVTECDSYSWNGTEYLASGVYTFETLNANGCDSIATLDLTINASSASTTEVTECDSYSWNGTEYLASGVYTFETLNANGCDSIATLDLTINASSASTTEVTECDSYSWNGTEYLASGVYTFETLNANGCDSIATLDLTINASSASTTEVTECDSYSWNGTEYLASGVYTFETLNANGCDSIATLDLTINASSASTTEMTECDSYSWNGTEYLTSGVYTFETLNANGCDSIATLDLTINASSASTTEVTECDSYSWNGTEYLASGVYTFETLNANGCDSIATLDLTINASSASTTEVTECDSYSWNGTEYLASGVYTFETLNANGCDSIATLDLTINSSSASTTEVTECDSYSWNGTEYLASGVYTFETLNANGCDSIATLDLTINASSASTTEVTECDSYSWNGTEYLASGVYTFETLNANGCDSIATLDLTINASSASTTEVTECDSYSWNGTEYLASGVYTFETLNANGCDSIATLDLTINASSASTTEVTECDSYSWNGTEYLASGVYTFETLNANGCDSIATLDLTINASSASTTEVTECDSYSWNGTEYLASGVYTFETLNANGCDSIATLDLTINASSASTTEVTECDSYSWNGTEYLASGVYTFETLNANGCDSIATLDLTINSSSASTTEVTECDSYSWNGTEYLASGVYTFETLNANGCDSIATLDLTINASSASTTEVTECDSYSWNGTEYLASGVYTFETLNANGCDSIATLDLTINASSASTTEVTECDSYSWNGTEYLASGVYTFETLNANGCDSTATLNLTINNSTTSTTDITECDEYTWNNQTYTVGGLYTYQTINSVGCDSIATLNLTLGYNTSTTIDITECDEYTWNNQTYTQSGTYTYQDINSEGCDGVATLNLTILNSTTSATDVIECDEYTWNNQSYTQSGAYTFQSTNSAGCDSTATLNLTINNGTSSATDVTECDSYSWNGTEYLTSGVYTFETLNANGCDSIATLDLTINASSASTTEVTECDSYSWNGTEYLASGVYTFETLNANGCDSIATLDLTINASSASTTEVTECDSYSWNGTEYLASGVYTFETLNANGCDSIATLDLTINASSASTTEVTECDSYSWNGTEYLASGVYTFETLNANGCDSIATLDLTINASSASTTEVTECDSYSWNGTEYLTSGVYTFETLNANGCDSIATLDLTINNVSDLTTTIAGITISANNMGATYQWLDCDNGFAIISGENGQSYTPVLNGNYAIELTENGCVDTTACIAITSVGILENSFGNDFVVYPNPTNGNFSVDLGANHGNVKIRITDANGRLIQSSEFNSAQILDLNISEASGVYLLTVESLHQKAVIRLVKQ